ncbi:MAG: acyl-CoA dehydrogenase family protein [Proteobacteria bacterium]|nr:acyl-CoA dehydrogenase family protein [Pseudomonadota bacterium]
MNFEQTDEQRALQDSLSRSLKARYSFEQRRAYAASTVGHDPQTWAQLAEMGIAGLLISEEYGGIGGRVEDLVPAMEEMGAALSLEPTLAGVLAATALAEAASPEQCRRLLPEVAAGRKVLAWAHDEPEGRHAAWWVRTEARREGQSWVLNGVKSPVLNAPQAGFYVVSARAEGQPGDRHGCALFLVDASAPGVRVRPFRLVDDQLAGEIELTTAPGEPLGDVLNGQRAEHAVERAQGVGIAAICADMVGAMQSAYRLATAYLNTRQQFGRPIGHNQALRHRAADMLVSLELAKSMRTAAAAAMDSPHSAESARDVHRAKLSVARHARQLAQSAIQIHGGIGMTEEFAVGHYLRRIHVLDQLLGDADAHAARLAGLLGAA